MSWLKRLCRRLGFVGKRDAETLTDLEAEILEQNRRLRDLELRVANPSDLLERLQRLRNERDTARREAEQLATSIARWMGCEDRTAAYHLMRAHDALVAVRAVHVPHAAPGTPEAHVAQEEFVRQLRRIDTGVADDIKQWLDGHRDVRPSRGVGGAGYGVGL